MTAIIMMLGLMITAKKEKIIIEGKKAKEAIPDEKRSKKIRLVKCPNSISLFWASLTKQILYLNTFKASISASISSFEL
jgi:hypothetical protein